MSDHPNVMDLIKAYADLVSELDTTYYLQDQDAINRHDAEINRIEKDMGIVWRDGYPGYADAAPDGTT